MILPLALCMVTLVICFVCLVWEIQRRNPRLVIAFSVMSMLMCWLTYQFAERAIEQHNNRVLAQADPCQS